MGKRSNFERSEFYPTPRAAVVSLIPHLRGHPQLCRAPRRRRRLGEVSGNSSEVFRYVRHADVPRFTAVGWERCLPTMARTTVSARR